MAKADTNIFLDLSTTKSQVPKEEALQAELKNLDLKIHRLKSSASWIDYITIEPSEADWHKQ